jgi:hypothetical protein
MGWCEVVFNKIQLEPSGVAAGSASVFHYEKNESAW